MSYSGLRIGITIGIHTEDESMWTNGIKQNAVYLHETLKNCPSVGLVCLVNTTQIAITAKLAWDTQRWPTMSFEQAKDHLDILIELGGQIDSQQTSYLKQKGTRLVSYCCGVEYVQTMEAILFNRPLFGLNLFINQRYDAIWMVPQVAQTSADYFASFRRQHAVAVPFVWSPIFLEQRTHNFLNQGQYRPHLPAKRLSIMEPNHDVVKFCLYPILIAEQAYRKQPQHITLLQVCNALEIAKNSPEFIALMNHLDIVREHKAVFLGRYDTPQFLSENSDIVISHQWDNPLNYFYFDVCWQGYPLIHNASLCKELGYYYEGNNVMQGSNALLHAINQHDLQWQDYRNNQRQIMARYLPENAEVLTHYDALLTALMQNPIR